MGEAQGPIRVMLVDDHEVVRLGLKSLLDRTPGLQVVAEAGTVQEAVAAARRTQPDVVVMDVRLPDGSGIDACREIRSERPETQVIMLTSYPDDEALFASITAGAAGYILKQTRGKVLAQAIETVSRGGSLLDPTLTQKVFERLRTPAKASGETGLASLTPQERRILELIAQGKTNKQIAEALYLSEKTIKHYVSNILSKLQVSRRSEAAAYLARHSRVE
ncbi:MAG: response regulator transcription factor [Firmicutes bacterium]|nr:response regulator transcription factor [Bacillota bacterium]